MRKLGMGLVVLGSLAITAEADNFHDVSNSSGVFASFDGVSADGCVHATGVFFTETTSEGPQAMLVANGTDTCGEDGPVTGSYIGFADVTYSGNGLGSATVSGSIDAWDYQAQLRPLSFDFSLAFQGTGNTIVERNRGKFVSAGGNVTMSFSTSRRRAANVTGTFTIDGGSATLTNAFIGTGTSGDISIAH